MNYGQGLGSLSLTDADQQPVETTKLIFLWSEGLSLITEGTVLTCDSVGHGLFVEEGGVCRAVALSNEVLICSPKMMRIGLRLHRDIGQLIIITSGDATVRNYTLFVLHCLPFFLLLLSVVLLHLWFMNKFSTSSGTPQAKPHMSLANQSSDFFPPF